MRPDDRWIPVGGSDVPASMPFDADLESLDAELEAAGRQARRALHGRTQPTRYFATDLRARLVGSLATAGTASAAAGGAPAGGAAAGGGAEALLARQPERAARTRPELDAGGETWAPTALEPRVARRTPTLLPRARWAILAAASLTGVLVAGALGARIDWLFPSPTPSPTARVAVAPTPKATPRASIAIVGPVETPAATDVPILPSDPPADPTASPRPTPSNTPRPTATPKPDPTKPPVGPMDLALKACPGGVVIDWTKPSPEVGHYHVLRSLTGDVAPAYPTDGATEVESATSWSPAITDGYDASIGGGKTATYRVFAFDAADHTMAYSPSRTVTTLDRISLGALDVMSTGPGSMSVSWAAADVQPGCFTYGKLVASEEDPDPSYLKGSPYLAVVSEVGATGVALDSLPSGKTVWMRYEVIRTTGTGKFLVASSDVLQVTFP